MRWQTASDGAGDSLGARTSMRAARVLQTVPRRAVVTEANAGVARHGLATFDGDAQEAKEALARRKLEEARLRPPEQLFLTADVGVAATPTPADFLPLGGGYLPQDGTKPAHAHDSGDSAMARRHLFSECEVVYAQLSEAVLEACASLQGCSGASSTTTIGLAMDGVVIEAIAPGSAAEDSKQLAAGDRILSIDGVSATKRNCVRLAVGPDMPGSNSVFEVRKAGTGHVINVTIARRPKHDERDFLRDLLCTARDRVSLHDNECAKMMDLALSKLKSSWARDDDCKQRVRDIADGLGEYTQERLREGRAVQAALHRSFLSLEDECTHAGQMSSQQEMQRTSLRLATQQAHEAEQRCEGQVAQTISLYSRYRSRILNRFSRRGARLQMRHHFEGLRQHREKTGLVKRLVWQALSRALSHNVKLLLCTIMYDWKDFVRRQSVLHQKLFRRVVRLYDGAASRALEVWSLWVIHERQLTKAGCSICMKAARTRLCWGFDCWNRVAVQQNRTRVKLAKMLMLTIKSVCARACGRWLEAASRERQLGVVARRIRKRRLRILLSGAFTCCRRNQLAQGWRKSMLVKALNQLRRRAVSRAFGIWRVHKTSQDEYKKVLMRVLGRWQRKAAAALATAWYGWLARRHDRQSIRRTLGKAILRMTATCCARAWNTWSLTARILRDRRVSVSKLVLRKAMASMARWKDMVDEVHKMTSTSQKIIYRLKHACLVNCLEA